MQVNGIVQTVLFSCLLLAASLWDIRKRIIPDSLCLGIAAVGLLNFILENLIGILLCLPLLIAALVKEGGMGGGDVKLVAACGFVLGITAGGAGLIIGMSAVLVWHLVLNGTHKLKRSPMLDIKSSTLPLAPFLSFGFITMTILKSSW